jgi:hypothetical protein
MELIDSPRWRTSSYTGNGGNNCVEVGADAETGRVLVRDTKDRQGPVLVLDPATWRRFTHSIKNRSA